MGGKNVPKTRHPLLEGRKGERKEERKKGRIDGVGRKLE